MGHSVSHALSLTSLLGILLSSTDTFANSLDPDQARHYVGLDPNCLTLMVFLKEVNLEKNS